MNPWSIPDLLRDPGDMTIAEQGVRSAVVSTQSSDGEIIVIVRRRVVLLIEKRTVAFLQAV